MRLLVFEDSIYWRDEQGLSTDRAFLLFASRLVDRVDRVVMLGRLSPHPGPSHYRIPQRVEFVALPFYASAAGWRVLIAGIRSLRTAWSAIGAADVAWLMGPHPLALLLAVLARLRRTKVVLGVRQDLPTYARRRHPNQVWTHRAADALEWLWRGLARRCSVVAVGPQLAAAYQSSKALLDLEISLVPARELVMGNTRSYDGSLQILSVGRLDAEKNPLLLAEVLAALCARDPRWHVVVCGDGPLRADLQERLRALNVADHAVLLGYVPVDEGLRDLYRASHVLLHVSWTEGVPQVLLEAWGFAVPVVATAVGGVTETARGAALLIPAGDSGAAVAALETVARDGDVRRRMVGEGTCRMAGRTMEAALDRLVGFLSAA
jgi:glycosyltransferase involved in cell wall biosynthesis